MDSSSTWIDYPFLKDYKNVGDTWESDTVRGILNGQNVTAKYVFTLTAKNIPYTANGIIYNDVIIVKEEGYIKDAPTSAFSIVSTDYSYYARHIGWVATTYPSSPTYNVTLLRQPTIQ